MSENIIEIKTVQASAFRILVEALKEILTDANFEIDETGIKMIAMDSSHTVLVHLKLTSDKFESYKCSEKRIIGIKLSLINNEFQKANDTYQQESNSNLGYLFAVFFITWVAFFGYLFFLSKKQHNIIRDIKELENTISQDKS